MNTSTGSIGKLDLNIIKGKHHEPERTAGPPMTLEEITQTVHILTEKVNKQTDNTEKVLKILSDWSDAGESIYKSDTATTTVIDYDYIRDIDHPVKGFTLINDGNNTINLGYNASEGLLDVSPERYSDVLTKEKFRQEFKEQRIRRIIVKTTSGVSNYRLWVWW